MTEATTHAEALDWIGRELVRELSHFLEAPQVRFEASVDAVYASARAVIALVGEVELLVTPYGACVNDAIIEGLPDELVEDLGYALKARDIGGFRADDDLSRDDVAFFLGLLVPGSAPLRWRVPAWARTAVDLVLGR